MLQHSYSTEKINRLHTEAQNVRLARQVSTQKWRKVLAQHLTNAAKFLDSELDVSFERKATA